MQRQRDTATIQERVINAILVDLPERTRGEIAAVAGVNPSQVSHWPMAAQRHRRSVAAQPRGAGPPLRRRRRARPAGGPLRLRGGPARPVGPSSGSRIWRPVSLGSHHCRVPVVAPKES